MAGAIRDLDAGEPTTRAGEQQTDHRLIQPHNNNQKGYMQKDYQEIHRAYQDAINAVDMMTAMLEDLRDCLKEINNYQNSPVNVSDDGEETKNGKL